jgi:hypothetical protein
LFEQKIILEAFSFFGVKEGGASLQRYLTARSAPPLTHKKTTLVQSHLSHMLVDLYIYCIKDDGGVKSILKCNTLKIGVESLLGCLIAQAFSGCVIHDIDDAVKVFLREVQGDCIRI